MRDKSATIYKKPDKQAHKGFFYLNDETVINSLSALESGKVEKLLWQEKVVLQEKHGFLVLFYRHVEGKNLRLELKRRWFVPGHVFRYLMLGINC